MAELFGERLIGLDFGFEHLVVGVPSSQPSTRLSLPPGSFRALCLPGAYPCAVRLRFSPPACSGLFLQRSFDSMGWHLGKNEYSSEA